MEQSNPKTIGVVFLLFRYCGLLESSEVLSSALMETRIDRNQKTIGESMIAKPVLVLGASLALAGLSPFAVAAQK
jgi:hypothetical protein